MTQIERNKRTEHQFNAFIDSEVDFVCKTKTGDIEYYQVAWQMTNETTVEREFGALEKINDNYPKFYSRQTVLHKTEVA